MNLKASTQYQNNHEAPLVTFDVINTRKVKASDTRALYMKKILIPGTKN
jgi:hypothetical protein